MAEKRKALGKGLGALIPSEKSGERPVDVFFSSESRSSSSDHGGSTVDEADRHDVSRETSPEEPAPDVSRETLVEVPGARFAELPVDRISANPRQPRSVFDEDAHAELAHSIGEVGVLQPIVVRRSSEYDDDFELIMGERRLRAAKTAGLEVIPAIVRESSEGDMLRNALLENLHRSELNPLEEAAAYRQLMDDFNCTQEELSDRIGRSRPQISNTLRLLRLPGLVQRRVAAGVISPGHARALLGLEDPSEMEVLAQRIVAEGLSVRATEEAVLLASKEERSTPPRRPRKGRNNPELDDLAGRLGDRLDTRVQISLGAKKGKMSLDFASVEDLNRILSSLGLEDSYESET